MGNLDPNGDGKDKYDFNDTLLGCGENRNTFLAIWASAEKATLKGSLPQLPQNWTAIFCKLGYY